MMANALAFIGGGLLSGIGKGLVESGKAKREEALKRIEQEGADKRMAGKEKFQRLMADLERKSRHGLLGERLQSDRDLASQREAGAEKRLGLNLENREGLASQASEERRDIASQATKSRADIARENRLSREKIGAAANTSREKAARIKASAAEGEISAADKRAIDIAVKRHTKAGSIVDHKKVVQQMLGMNRRDLAELYAGVPIGPTGLTQEQAEKQVEVEAEERKEFFKSRADEFPETDGDEAAWRKLRLSQLAPQSTATASAPVPSPTSPAATPAGTPSQAAIAHLKANPALAPQFDQKYGAGAAAKALGR